MSTSYGSQMPRAGTGRELAELEHEAASFLQLVVDEAVDAAAKVDETVAYLHAPLVLEQLESFVLVLLCLLKSRLSVLLRLFGGVQCIDSCLMPSKYLMIVVLRIANDAGPSHRP